MKTFISGVETLLATDTLATGDVYVVQPVARTFQAVGRASGAVGATVIIRVSNDGANFLDLATITLTGETVVTDGFASSAPWRYVRADVTGVAAGTAVTVTLGA